MCVPAEWRQAEIEWVCDRDSAHRWTISSALLSWSPSPPDKRTGSTSIGTSGNAPDPSLRLPLGTVPGENGQKEFVAVAHIEHVGTRRQSGRLPAGKASLASLYELGGNFASGTGLFVDQDCHMPVERLRAQSL